MRGKFVLLAVAMGLAFSGSAVAKDAFTTIKNLEGMRVIQTFHLPPADCVETDTVKVKKRANDVGKTPTKPPVACVPPAPTSELVEFAYVGASELWLIRQGGKAEVRMPSFGSPNLSWRGNGGKTYQVVPGEENQVSSVVYVAGQEVGSFVVTPSKVAVSPLDGRWTGNLNFKGGMTEAVSFLGTSTVRQFPSEGCGMVEARMVFTQSTVSDIQWVVCPDPKSGVTAVSTALLLLDQETNNVWFLSFQGTQNNLMLQGDITAMPLFDGAVQSGEFAFTAATPFLLPSK